MATFLDLSLLSGVRAIFAFLLIFSLMYGVIKYSNFFKLNDGVAALIAFSLAILSVMSPSMVKVIEVITPWYTLMFFFIVILLITVSIFGNLGDSFGEIHKNMGGAYKTVVVWVIVLSAIIFFAGVGQVFLGGDESDFSVNNENEGPNNFSVSSNINDVDGKGSSAFLDAFFNPKVLGVLMLMLIALFTVYFMGGPGSGRT